MYPYSVLNESKLKMAKHYNELTNEEENVIINKGTERPFTGKYEDFIEGGLYICKQCDAPLYKSQHKFQSTCGWPSFDDEVAGAIKRVTDADGRRVEIVCANCDGHLGHVFEGEGLTEKNIRHCVNSVSMKFVSTDDLKKQNTEKKETEKSVPENKTAYFAGGCFWGVEHFLQKQEGVLSVESGYMGGASQNPTYQEICGKKSGHLEVVEVNYKAKEVSFETLAKLFFEIHDPTQTNGQGPDLGPQYASAIFYQNDEEKQASEKLISILEGLGLTIATQLIFAETFWKAEDYHQDYYQKNGQQPYCHSYQKRF
ncbi:MAG: peptide methionine sulfoxide reductase msrA/msrB [Polaribacter sp.]|jgi:peptide methionine sulfoxide reductase msrA/msrB